MSDEEEYDDELPPISVNSSAKESGAMQMPTAEELASRRAREAECERELRLLRAADDPVLHTADSSGSEGEAALAAAVTKLQMAGAARERSPELAQLLPAVLARLPPAAAALAERARLPSAADALLNAVCSAVSGESLPAGAAWLAAAVASAGAVAGPGPAARRAARRALCRLLAHPPLLDPTTEDSLTLKAALLDGVSGSGARLELADALQPARASPAAALLHRRLLAAALADLLDCEPAPAESGCLCAWAARVVGGAWSRLEACRGAGVLRASGRLARACPSPAACAPARAALLHALAAPAAPAARRQPDRLEVLVGASKLQLLFRE